MVVFPDYDARQETPNETWLVLNKTELGTEKANHIKPSSTRMKSVPQNWSISTIMCDWFAIQKSVSVAHQMKLLNLKKAP